MRNFMTITATCVLLTGLMTTSLSAAETDYVNKSCIDGVCTDIPIVESVSCNAVLIGEFYRTQTTYDCNGNAVTKVVLVKRYSRCGTPYVPCK